MSLSFLRPHWARLTLGPSTSTLPTRNRHLSSTRPVLQGEEEEEAAEREDVRDDKAVGTETYEAWIQSEGPKWQHPDSLGRTWLGGNVPFPRNPTFQPPTPLSDNLRSTIYMSYVNNPTANDPHTLSTRYGIAVRRIEAILSLKQLESKWKQGIPLQTGFRKGMERLLGVSVGGHEQSISQEISSSSRNDVNEADELSRSASEHGERKRGLSRTFFEAVDEGQDAVMPRILEEHREKAEAARARRTEYPTTIVQPNPSKPPFKFVDVGLRWFDAREMERRQKESVRRQAIKAGKRTVKLASMSSTPHV